MHCDTCEPNDSAWPAFLQFLRRGLLSLVIVAAGIGWLEREPLQAWFYLRGLARADEANRAAWVKRVASLEGAAVPGLVALLGQDDARACANAEATLRLEPAGSSLEPAGSSLEPAGSN